MAQSPSSEFPQRDTYSHASTWGQLTPQSLEAEQSTLGAMLMERDAVAHAIELLRPEDFYREIHKRIYKAIVELFNKSEPIDIVSVAEVLRKSGQLQDIGGREYLSALIEACPSSLKIDDYARVVIDKSARRQLIRTSDEIAKWAYDSQSNGEENVSEVVDRSNKRVSEIGLRFQKGGFTHILPAIMTAYDQIERQYQHRGVAGLSTGFVDLDDITSGLQPSNLIIVAGRPSMGKTGLVLNIVHHVALKERQPVAFFSLELPREKLVQRLICAEAFIKSQDLIRGNVEDSGWHRITNAVNNLYQAPIFIDDQPGQNPAYMRDKARRLTAEHGQLGLIVVDYLQLASSVSKRENRTQEISELTRELKSLSHELKCPIIALSQLSRAVEQREDKRPRLSDLRESGSIEDEADLVAFIYRPSYYKHKMRGNNGQPDPNAEPDPDEGMAEVIIAKQRNGPVGTIRLGFQPEYARFTNLARNDYGGEY